MTSLGNSTKFLGQLLVRRYTEDLDHKQAEGHSLSTVERALVVETEQEAPLQELNHWLEQLQLEKAPSSQALQLLEDHAKSLSSTWRTFTQHLTVEDRHGLNNRNPSWEDVKKVIDRVQASWMARKEGTYGTAVVRLNKVLQTLHAHRTFLKIIPNNDDYVSIVCGSLQVLIKASANHRKVSEGLSRAIVEINDIVRLCNVDLHLFEGDHLMEIAALMYTWIFKFLERAMTWYAQSRARRFFNAFKEDAYEEFEDDITEIRRVSDGIRRRAQQGANVENRLTNLIVQENRQDIKDVKKMLQEIGRHGKLLCISNAEAHYAPMLKDRFQETKVNKESNLETRKTDELKEPDASQDTATKTSLTHSARHLRRHWEGCKSLVSAERLGTIFVEIRVVSLLQEWIPQRSSPFLCVIGPRQTAPPTLAYQLAAVICSFATQAEASLIHASCVTFFEGPQDLVEPEAALINLVNSLTAQLIDILPADSQFNEDLPIFDRDGTLENWALAMHTLKILLDASPSPLFCIINNWQCLENPVTDNKHLTQLLHVFREHSANCKSARCPRPFKVLITTSGRSVSLLEEFEPHEIVLADQLASHRTPGKSRPGRSPLVPPSSQLFVN